MLFLIKLLVQFIISIIITLMLYSLIISFRLKSNKRPINAPQLIPFIGNIHLVASSHIFYKGLYILQKYSSPIRIKCLTYETIIIDTPDDIRKIELANKSDLYEAMPFNNGLVSIKGEYCFNIQM